ncbi:uncharacterized protein LOC131020622 isoform X2 [Salvia miltiorrhiza]|uniref:uncharacterized protein LOC131020622 isoform X2 n=1 Tax=Salvia miltiorrhiza TaxID=226208 RepID=UPI0025AC44C3|nr:uncharacterized protein LOC131020622 isoform X2 [Salvia miltiorrhiza]
MQFRASFNPNFIIMAPNTKSHGNRGRHSRRAQNDSPDSVDDLTDTQLGLDHIERPANMQLRKPRTNRGWHQRSEQNNDILDSLNDSSEREIGLDHIERSADIQVRKPRTNRGWHQRTGQENYIIGSLNDSSEREIGLDHIERSADIQVRKPRTNRGRRQRTGQNNDIIGSLNDSSEREIVQNTSENVQEVGCRTSKNNSENVTTELDGGNKKKRARGPTCMPKVWGLNKNFNVSFNELGQPNDRKQTSTLAHFLGTIARNGSFCPLHYTDWRLMPNSYKEDMLREVKSRFTMRAGSDSFILQSINHKWRNWKCQLKSLNFDPSVSIEEQLLTVPERVNAHQYKKLLDHWNTDKAQEHSEKNKEARAKLEIPHRMGKRSYAVMAEVMYEELGRHPTRAELFEKCCYPSNGSATSETVREAIEKMKEQSKQNDGNLSDCDVVHDADDAFAKILGKDKDGRLRMYGMGVKPSDIYGGRPSRDALHRKSMEDKEEVRALKQKVEELTALVYSKSHSDTRIETQRAPVSTHNNRTSSNSSGRPTRIRVGACVKLKSLVNLNEIVAIGIVKEIGNVWLNGRDLGPGICEVIVQTILKNEEMLIYPTDLHETIGDTIGAPIAWPLSLIALDEDEN